MARIGFVGLGHMGLPMALNLIHAGHDVIGADLQLSACEQLVHAGGHTFAQLALPIKVDILITMLQTGQQVQQVCLGEQGFYALTSPDLHIDCSSIDVVDSRALHQHAAEQHILSVDAPVSGGVGGATKASLTFMVGGELEAFNQAHPILSAMGKTIYHTGSAGSGQAAKMCNNMILGISMIAVSEAFVLAEQLGLSAQQLFEVVTHSSGQCWAISNYAPVPGILPNVPANNDYQPGFSAAMMLKDLLLSQQAAAQHGVLTTLGAQATERYKAFVASDLGHLDFSAIIKTI